VGFKNHIRRGSDEHVCEERIIKSKINLSEIRLYVEYGSRRVAVEISKIRIRNGNRKSQ